MAAWLRAEKLRADAAKEGQTRAAAAARLRRPYPGVKQEVII